MPEDCLIKACYQLKYNAIHLGRQNLASDIKNILFIYGFGYIYLIIWEQQFVENYQGFLVAFKQRLEDCYIQSWNTAKMEMSKLSLYNLFKTDFVKEPYLYLNIPRRLRRYLAKFRVSNTSLEIESGRHAGIIKEDRLCKICGQHNQIYVEDESHVLLKMSSIL